MHLHGVPSGAGRGPLAPENVESRLLSLLPHFSACVRRRKGLIVQTRHQPGASASKIEPRRSPYWSYAIARRPIRVQLRVLPLLLTLPASMRRLA